MAGEAFSRAQSAAAKARGTDSTMMISTLEDQIQSLDLSIEFYKQSLAGSRNPIGVKITRVDKNGQLEEKTAAAPDMIDGVTPKLQRCLQSRSRAQVPLSGRNLF
jgi:hypothetical protein